MIDIADIKMEYYMSIITCWSPERKKNVTDTYILVGQYVLSFNENEYIEIVMKQ